jgi:CRP-like cAMP-binding protein
MLSALKGRQSKHGGCQRNSLREEQLLNVLTQEDDGLMEQLRKEDDEKQKALRREAEWERAHPIISGVVLLPASRLRMSTELVVAVGAVVSVVVTPPLVASALSATLPGGVVVSGALWWSAAVLEGIFCVDILLGFLTAQAPSSQSTLIVKRPGRIARIYLSSWFIVDVVGAAPLSVLLRLLPDGLLSPDDRWLLSLGRLVHLLRLCKLPRVLAGRRRLQGLRLKLGTASAHAFYYLLALLALFHTGACLYCIIVQVEILGLAGHADPATLSFDKEHGWLPPGQFEPFDHLGDASLGAAVYMFAFWWSMGVVTSSAVPTPTTTLEAVFTSSLGFFGLLFYTILLAQLTTALMQISSADSAEMEMHLSIDRALRQSNIPGAVRRRCKQFFRFRGGSADSSLLERLPSTLRVQLKLVQNRELFLRVPFLRSASQAEISRLVDKILTEFAWPGSTIVQEGEAGRGLFLVIRGFLKVSEKGQLLELICRNDFFGELSLVSVEPAHQSVCAITLSELRVLPWQAFDDILASSPKIKSAAQRYTRPQQQQSDQRSGARARARLQQVKIEMARLWHVLSAPARRDLQQSIHELEEVSWLRKSISALVRISGERSSRLTGGVGLYTRSGVEQRSSGVDASSGRHSGETSFHARTLRGMLRRGSSLRGLGKRAPPGTVAPTAAGAA